MTALSPTSAPRFDVVRRRARLRRLWATVHPSSQDRFRLLPLDATVAALGRRAEFELGCQEVPLSRISGT